MSLVVASKICTLCERIENFVSTHKSKEICEIWQQATKVGISYRFDSDENIRSAQMILPEANWRGTAIDLAIWCDSSGKSAYAVSEMRRQ